MATYYVSPTGNDAAAGTSTGTAFKSLTKAQTASGVSDTIVLMNGTFTLSTPLALTSSDNTTTWIAQAGATPIISGASKELPLITMDGATGITVSGITFSSTTGGVGDDFDSVFGAIEISGGSGIVVTESKFQNVSLGVKTLDGATDITVSNCTFTDLEAGAVFLDYGSNQNLVTQNVIVRTGTKYLDSSSIDLFETWGNTISHNSIDDIPRHGIQEQNWDGGNKSGQNVIEYNVITRFMTETVDGGGIYLFAGDDPNNHLGSIVRYNYVEGQGVEDAMSWGIYLDDYISNGQFYGNFVNGGGVAAFMIHGGDNNVVYNNVLINGGSYGFTIQESAIDPEDPIFGNDVYLNLIKPGPEAILGASTASGDQWRDNIYVAVPAVATSQFHGWDGETFQQWQTAGGDDGSILIASASFVNEAGGDYRFVPGSTPLTFGMVQLPWDLMGPTEAGSEVGSDGTASGTGTASAVGRRIAASAGTAAGTGTATAVGRRTAAAAGTAAGTGTATGFSSTITGAQAVGTAAGTGVATGAGTFVSGNEEAVGVAAGVGSATGYTSIVPIAQNFIGISGSTLTMTFTATGTITISTGGAPSFPPPASAVGLSTGSSSVSAVGRRTAASVGTAQGFSTVTGRAVGPIPGTMDATITISGVPYEYDPTVDGVDRGTYVDPLGRFQQQSIEVRRVDQPNICLHFRYDVGVDRQEVVVEQGRIIGPLVSITYSIVIRKNGSPVFSGTITKHDARTSWRWQSAVRPATVTVASLLAQHLLPPLDIDGSGGFTPAPPPVTYTGYGSRAGMTAFMISTGENREIGPLTEYQSRYILLGAANMLSSADAQAEAIRSYELVVRDENTGAPYDYRANVQATMYSGGNGNPQIVPWNTDRDEYPDMAHFPNASYLRFLMTGDPYDLESMQMAVSWSTLSLPYGARQYFCATFGVRAHAWHLRMQAICAKVTPDVVPSWLLPRSYWQADLNDNLNYMNGLATNPLPIHSFVRAINTATSNSSGTMINVVQIQPYQDYFQAFVIGWVVWMGFTEWMNVHIWKSGMLIAMTNGTSGWVRARPAPYNMALQDAPAIPSDPNSRPPMPSTWGGLFALNQQLQPEAVVYTDANMLEPSSKVYASYMRAALVMAALNGVPNAAASAAWLDGEFERIISPADYIDIKWSYHLP